jgi:hypothetical protein
MAGDKLRYTLQNHLSNVAFNSVESLRIARDCQTKLVKTDQDWKKNVY